MLCRSWACQWPRRQLRRRRSPCNLNIRPWSSAPSPWPPPPPHTRSLRHSARPLVTRRVNSHSCTSHRHVSSGCNSSWTVPQGIGYHQHLNTSEVSVSVLSRVQASSTLSAATIDRVPFFANRFLNKLIGFHTRLSTWVVQGPEYPFSSSL